MQVLLFAGKLSILNLCFLIGILNGSTNVNRVNGKSPKALLHAPVPAALTGDRAFSFLQSVMHASGMRIFMTVKGQIQGEFLGGPGEENERNHYIEITGYEYDVKTPYDAVSGIPTGRQLHKPMTITKLIDKSTPQFFQALVTNEDIKTIQLQFFQEYPSTEAHYSITLKNCKFSEINQFLLTEKVSIIFQEIEINFGEMSSKDSWIKH